MSTKRSLIQHFHFLRFAFQSLWCLLLILSCVGLSANATDYDYDGDGKADVAVRRASNQFWYVKNTGDDNFNSERQDGIQRIQFGLQATDIPVAADYDGDGITDIAVRRPSNFTWYIRNSSGSDFNSEREDGIQRIVFGRNSADIPVPADYDGDNIADIAVRRVSNSTWYIRNSSGENFNSEAGDGIQRVMFGLDESDIPVRGDFNGDGIDDIAVRRPSNYTWYIRNSDGSNYNSEREDGIQRVVFGMDSDDIPVPADYDGDSITDIAVRRPSNYTWYILNSSNGETQTIVFGKNSDDIPVPADYDGDGKADVAVRRPGNQFFYVLNSSDGEIQRINLGTQEDDIPVSAPLPEVIEQLEQLNSGSDSEPENSIPVANAGADVETTVGTSVTLDASASSDADGDSLTWQWSLVSAPSGSSAVIENASSQSASITPDVAGEYQVGLIVSDGQAQSAQDLVQITAAELVTIAEPDFYAPQPIINIIGNQRSVDWTSLGDSVADLLRFSFGPGDSTDVFLLEDSQQQVESVLQLSVGLAEQSRVADETLLNGMFKLIAQETNSEQTTTYRIVSTKHSNYVLDADDSSDAVILRDYRSGSRDDNSAGYLVFSVTEGSGYQFEATGRYVYDSTSESFVEDTQWQSQNLIINESALALSTGDAADFQLYNAAIDFTMPFDLNPEDIERVSNAEVTPFVKDGDLSGTATQINSTYADQVSAPGNDEATAAAALAMLETIETTLEAENSALRYPIDFYVAAREGLLSRIYVSSDSTDGVIGQNTVPYVYFTNEADDDGVHHPFMVIASYNLPDSLTLLWDVPRPPGDGLGESYDEESVTRSIHKELLLMKIPLRDYGEVESLTENNMENDLATDVGETAYDHHNYASTSSTGVAMDGVLIYPSYNNRLHISQSEAELSAHGMHSGRGLGAHYHADAFSANPKGLNLYNNEDYQERSHPPIITLGFDGIAGYGVYLDGDEHDGYDVELDEFGGHEHGDYGYHYHSWPEAEVTDAQGVNYTAHQLPPLGAWSGRINDIPEFWSGTKPNVTGGRSKWLGNE